MSRTAFIVLAIAGCSDSAGGTSFASSAASSSESTAAADDTTTTSESTGTSMGPLVRISTSLGDLVFEIHELEAPITSANFLRYVDEDRFATATFYRTVTLDNQPDDPVKIEVIQGGLGGASPDALPPIEHESTAQTGLMHVDGTLSMARAEVGTASSEFFVCVGDQPELDFGGTRNPDGQGFAAFGSLREGADVVQLIHEAPASGQDLQPPIAIVAVARE